MSLRQFEILDQIADMHEALSEPLLFKIPPTYARGTIAGEMSSDHPTVDCI